MKTQIPKSVDLTFIGHDIISGLLCVQKHVESVTDDNSKSFIQEPQKNSQNKNPASSKIHNIHTRQWSPQLFLD